MGGKMLLQCGNFISWCDEYVRVLHNQRRLQMDTSERLNVTTHPTNTNDSNELAMAKIEMHQLRCYVCGVVVNVIKSVVILILSEAITEKGVGKCLPLKERLC